MMKNTFMLADIVSTFKNSEELSDLNAQLEYYRTLSLHEAIDNAVFGRYVINGIQFFNSHYMHFLSYKEVKDRNNKVISKGWNLVKLLYPTRENLFKVGDTIAECKTFDELYGIIKSNATKGLAELFCYDTALRIGNSMMFESKGYLMPNDVFIQRGAKDGAASLFKGETALLGARYIPIGYFDRFGDCFKGMDPYAIECFLCVKKDRLATI